MATQPGGDEPRVQCDECGRFIPQSEATYLAYATGPRWYCGDAWWRALRAASPEAKVEAVAGVSDMTVGRIARSTASNVAVERPAETLGADGPLPDPKGDALERQRARQNGPRGPSAGA
jgi:hypothetical protein